MICIKLHNKQKPKTENLTFEDFFLGICKNLKPMGIFKLIFQPWLGDKTSIRTVNSRCSKHLGCLIHRLLDLHVMHVPELFPGCPW